MKKSFVILLSVSVFCANGYASSAGTINPYGLYTLSAPKVLTRKEAETVLSPTTVTTALPPVAPQFAEDVVTEEDAERVLTSPEINLTEAGKEWLLAQTFGPESPQRAELVRLFAIESAVVAAAQREGYVIGSGPMCSFEATL